MDAVKQKRQLSLKQYRGTLDCLRTVLKVEGVRALYAGYTTTLTMNVPYNFVYFATYESLRKIFKMKREFDPIAHFIAGGGYFLRLFLFHFLNLFIHFSKVYTFQTLSVILSFDNMFMF
jgi:hypothetical protein